MIIMFYIDDLLLVHKNPNITTKYIKLLNSIYRIKDQLKVIRKKIHKYLRMTVDFTSPVGCVITQYDFIKKLQRDLDVDFKGPYRNNLAAISFFKVDSQAQGLKKEKQEEYYKTIAKCIQLS